MKEMGKYCQVIFFEVIWQVQVDVNSKDFWVLVQCFSQYLVYFFQVFENEIIFKVVEWFFIEGFVMSDSVGFLMSYVELMSYDWFLWFVVIFIGIGIIVIF